MSVTSVQTIVKAAAAVVVGFGFIVAMAAHSSTSAIAAFFADLLFWPVDGLPRLDAPEARLLAGIGGGVMVGWGITLWMVATRVLPLDPALAASIIKASVLSWFVVDSVASIAAGAPLNAALNLAFVAAFLWPLSQLGAGAIDHTSRAGQ